MILADENLACLAPLFGELGELKTLPGRSISPDVMADVQILLVRSVTQVNRALIDAAPQLKFVGTATIGVDHLDIDTLDEREIPWCNAPGCNAEAVGEYVLSALSLLARNGSIDFADKTVGVIGAGNTGSATIRRLRAMGVEPLVCDPPKQRRGEPGLWYSVDEIIERCNVICCHVPLIDSGPDSTRYLLDENRLGALQPGTWVINVCRGEVIDNRALISVKKQRPDLKLVLDVWEGEPSPMPELVAMADVATAHIAGYSLEGKARGSLMLRRALAQYNLAPEAPDLESILATKPLSAIQMDEELDWNRLDQLCCQVYDLGAEDNAFRQALNLSGGFDARRKANLARREFCAQPVVTRNITLARQLASLGFQVKE